MVRLAVLLVLLTPVLTHAAQRPCFVGDAAEIEADAVAMRTTLAAIDAECPCTSYSFGNGSPYRGCLKAAVAHQVASSLLRAKCASPALRLAKAATCGTRRVPCVSRNDVTGDVSCKISLPSRCLSSPSKTTLACPHFHRCLDAADTNSDLVISGPGDSGLCAPYCGDHHVDPGEQCDDGNLAAFDGCDGICQLEPTCDPDATYIFTTPLPFSCGSGTTYFDQLTFTDDGGRIDLGLSGTPPLQSPLSCLGSSFQRTDIGLVFPIECFFVARVEGSFTSTGTVSGRLYAGYQGYLGGPCTPGPLPGAYCPEQYLGEFTAVR